MHKSKASAKQLRRLLIVGPGKGGTGKTWVVTLIHDWLDERKVRHIVADCDTENRGKATAISSFVPSNNYDLRSDEDTDNLMTLAAESEAQVIIADLGAGSGRDIATWFDQLSRSHMEQMAGVRVVLIGVVTNQAGVLAALYEWATILQDKVDYLPAFNLVGTRHTLGDYQDAFVEHFGTKKGRDFRAAFGDAHVVVPAMADTLSKEIYATRKTLRAIVNNNVPIQGARICLTDTGHRMRFRGYLDQVYQQLDSGAVRPLLY